MAMYQRLMLVQSQVWEVTVWGNWRRYCPLGFHHLSLRRADYRISCRTKCVCVDFIYMLLSSNSTVHMQNGSILMFLCLCLFQDGASALFLLLVLHSYVVHAAAACSLRILEKHSFICSYSYIFCYLFKHIQTKDKEAS